MGGVRKGVVDTLWDHAVTPKAPFIAVVYKGGEPGLCDNTITDLNIVIDVEILQNLLILSCYWY